MNSNAGENMRHRFISFEGIDRKKNAAYAQWLHQELINRRELVEIASLAGMVLGQKLRDLDLQVQTTTQTSALMFAAAQRELLSTVIEPSLAQDKIVIGSDFFDHGYAYFVARLGMAYGSFKALDAWCGGPRPSLTLLVDTDHSNSAIDNSQECELTAKLRDGFLHLASINPERIQVVAPSLREPQAKELILGTIYSEIFPAH